MKSESWWIVSRRDSTDPGNGVSALRSVIAEYANVYIECDTNQMVLHGQWGKIIYAQFALLDAKEFPSLKHCIAPAISKVCGSLYFMTVHVPLILYNNS